MTRYNIAVIGSGGREHAICHFLSKSPKIGMLFCIPGNAGISEIAECAPIDVMDFEEILKFIGENDVDLVFVAPDNPLAAGLVDCLTENGIPAFGPDKKAAVIEGSKAFAKDFMKRNCIPTADYEIFDDYDKARTYVKTAKYPIVIKADGLALGKGVIICENVAEAEKALEETMMFKVFKDAGNKVVIEEFLTGHEMSLFVFTDGVHYSLMPSVQDYKKAFNGDKGPNTGGMGAITPSPYFTEMLKNRVIKEIIEPTITAMREEGRTFKGVLYFGLMVNGDKAKVLEYNARFGDPETQVLLPLLKTDFVDIIVSVIDGNLNEIDIEWEDKACAGVVLASGGYPTDVVKGYPITIGDVQDAMVFHAGTDFDENEQLVTNGGRVFCVSAKADTLSGAVKKAYSEAAKISFKDMRKRDDIGLVAFKET